MAPSNTSFANPFLKDRIELLEDTETVLKFRTYLQPQGGQTAVHYHTQIQERFTIVSGTLTVLLDTTTHTFQENDTIVIKPYTAHRFYNTSALEVIFDVEVMTSGQMKEGLQIMYGLAKDGRIYTNGLPKNVLHLAIGLQMMDAYSAGVPLVFQKIGIRILVGIARVLGIEKAVRKQYCRI